MPPKRKPQNNKRGKKDDDEDENTNQKNNWAVEKQDISRDEYLKLRAKLFKRDERDENYIALKDKNFYRFAAISYFWFEPNDNNSNVPNRCIRCLRIFLQLTSRKYLWDVESDLGLSDLKEYMYDPLDEDSTAIDAKKAFHSVVGNYQEAAFAGLIRKKVFYISFFLKIQ